MPSREPALPLLVLQEWIRKHRIVPFQINCNSQCPDTKTNESNYNVLGKLLSEKNIVSCVPTSIYMGCTDKLISSMRWRHGEMKNQRTESYFSG